MCVHLVCRCPRSSIRPRQAASSSDLPWHALGFPASPHPRLGLSVPRCARPQFAEMTLDRTDGLDEFGDALCDVEIPLVRRTSTSTVLSAADAATLQADHDELFDELEKEGAVPTGGDATRRKVRHNLTERRRVDRMNQLFNKLYTAIESGAQDADAGTTKEGAPAALTVLGAESKSASSGRWSKADVLEGAINVITDLRKQLEEERLGRACGLSSVASEHGGHSDACSDSDRLSDAYGEHMLRAVPALLASVPLKSL